MWIRRVGLVVTIFLGAHSGRTDACSYAVPSVADAVQLADIIAFGVVDSITVDEWGIIQSAVFTPDRLLKGSTDGPLLLHGSSLANSPCAGDAVRPYASGERVMMMLSEDGTGSFEPPLFVPMLMHIRDDHRASEQTLSGYLTTVIAGISNPVEVRLRCQPQYAVDEEIEVRALVINHLSIPVILSTDMLLKSDVPIVRLRIPDLEYGDPLPNTGHWVIPAKGTREIGITLQDYFGVMGEGEYFASAHIDVDSHEEYWDYVGPESVATFAVTTSTVIRGRGWGETKCLLLGK